ncbi:membrane protein [gut metagenome]|uniref:Membrane protein n=1 Tax=gut metagenome TaxID=749906 RepID=J9GJN6_9ZZZZ
MKRNTLITIFCISTFIIIPLFVDLFIHGYYTKCFVIAFLFVLSTIGLHKRIRLLSN